MKYDYNHGDKWTVEYINSQTEFRLSLGGNLGLTIEAIPPDVLIDLYLNLGQQLKQSLIEERLGQCNWDGLHNWAVEGLGRHYDDNPNALREGWQDIVEDDDEDDEGEKYEL